MKNEKLNTDLPDIMLSITRSKQKNVNTIKPANLLIINNFKNMISALTLLYNSNYGSTFYNNNNDGNNMRNEIYQKLTDEKRKYAEYLKSVNLEGLYDEI